MEVSQLLVLQPQGRPYKQVHPPPMQHSQDLLCFQEPMTTCSTSIQHWEQAQLLLNGFYSSPHNEDHFCWGLSLIRLGFVNSGLLGKRSLQEIGAHPDPSPSL